MTRAKKLLLAGSVAVLVAGGGAIAVAKTMPHHWGGGHFGMSGGMFGGPMCHEKNDRAARMGDRLEKLIQPTAAQKAYFDALKAALVKAQEEVQATCPKDGEVVDRTPPAMLSNMEVHLTAMLDGVKTVRPAAEKLYASLDDKQKDRLRWAMPFGDGEHHHRGMKGDGEKGRGYMMQQQ